VHPLVVRTHLLPGLSPRQVKAGATNSQAEFAQCFFAARACVAARSERAEKYDEPVRDVGAKGMPTAESVAVIAKTRKAVWITRPMREASCPGLGPRRWRGAEIPSPAAGKKTSRHPNLSGRERKVLA